MELLPAGRDEWNVHWQEYAASATENPAQRYRRERAFGLMHDQPARLVDIGSGQGDLLDAAQERWPAAELVGIELSAAGIAVAQRKVPRASFVQRDLLDEDAPSSTFDGWGTHAICSEVLEHVDAPVALLRNAKRFLAPGARLVVTVPGGPRSAFDKHIGHRRHFTRGTLHVLLVDAGFVEVKVQASGFPAFNLYKLMVIARGRRLIDDARVADGDGGTRAARLVMRCFRPLFKVALPHHRWGWQLVATAHLPR